ncbi:hypothetical protein ACFYTQ_26695 [Nocardia sp. NPDC004068]|uniref:hypothetical protein n=1 Tax=Nocardia sp. NPDC004068 TaxID=3364303 RepID=UPI00369D44A8
MTERSWPTTESGARAGGAGPGGAVLRILLLVAALTVVTAGCFVILREAGPSAPLGPVITPAPQISHPMGSMPTN